jgi:hypothetical protein
LRGYAIDAQTGALIDIRFASGVFGDIFVR